MKFATLAIMALVSAMSVTEVNAIQNYREKAHRQQLAEESSDSSSSDSDSDSDAGFVQLGGDGEWKADGFYRPQDIGTGPLDKKYERNAPEHFTAGSDDLFMHSMIMNYSDEGRLCNEETKECKPTGVFTIPEAAARAAAAEVLATHKGLKGEAGAEYLKSYFARTWAHFDVNKEGRIGVETMPMFLRFLSSDQTLNLQ